MPRSLSAVVACLAFALAAPAADPPATPHADLDKLAVEVLKDLHNRGADLYNSADAPGALRLYEATLRAVGPFLAHRPKLQATIADGLADAGRLDGAKAQAYRLHEVIDLVRNDLKAAMAADAEPKPGERKADPKPDEPKASAKPPEPPTIGSLGGVLTLDGQPLATADVTLVSLTLAKPRVFTATTDTGGRFAFPAELPPATYVVMVTGGAKPPPAKYRSTMTSGVELVVKAGPNTADLNLQSK